MDIEPNPHNKNAIKRTVHYSNKNWIVARTPRGKYCKVKRSNRAIIPTAWGVYYKGSPWFEKSGDLSDRGLGLLEIKSRKHAKWFASPAAHDFGLLIGLIDVKKGDFS